MPECGSHKCGRHTHTRVRTLEGALCAQVAHDARVLTLTLPQAAPPAYPTWRVCADRLRGWGPRGWRPFRFRVYVSDGQQRHRLRAVFRLNPKVRGLNNNKRDCGCSAVCF